MLLSNARKECVRELSRMKMVLAGFRLFLVMAIEISATTPSVASRTPPVGTFPADNALSACRRDRRGPSFGHRMRAIGVGLLYIARTR